MPAFAALTINDGQATPVAHTFSPARIDEKGVASFYDRSGGIAIGFTRLTVRLTEPVSPKAGTASNAMARVYRATITADVPVLESTSAATGSGIAPAPTVAYVHSSRMTLDCPERGTLANRNDLIAYSANALGNATIKSVIQNLESFY